MGERELLSELREVVRIADDVDATDWQRGYRSCAELVTRWAGQRAQLDRPNRIMVLGEPASTVDYRALLVRYIGHVGDEEGTVFLNDDKRPPGRFTDAEWAELCNLADALYREAALPRKPDRGALGDPASGVWADGSPVI